jgi:hypothetical protein
MVAGTIASIAPGMKEDDFNGRIEEVGQQKGQQDWVGSRRLDAKPYHNSTCGRNSAVECQLPNRVVGLFHAPCHI